MPSFQMIRIEDAPEDIIGKAQICAGLSLSELAEQSGQESEYIQRLKKGIYNVPTARAVCPPLNLHFASLDALAHKRYLPKVTLPGNVTLLNTPFPVPGYEEMTVNAYLLKIPNTNDVLLFDTGASATAVTKELQQRNLNLRAIFITHTHGDHIAALDELKATLPSFEVYSPESEPVEGSKPVAPGNTFTFDTNGPAGTDDLVIEARLTNGHSPGGTTYVARIGGQPFAAFVGDAIFAGSIGGIRFDHQASLDAIRREILTLPEQTVICPGHGPVTSVIEENTHNPFFAK